MVHWELAGKIFFSAQVVETLPRLTSALIQRLTEKGIVSLTQIQERLSKQQPKNVTATVKDTYGNEYNVEARAAKLGGP